MYKFSYFVIILATLSSCGFNQEEGLPILGQRDIDKATGETHYQEIRDFSFVNQDSVIVTNATFENGIYVADFFFTSCPTICPKVAKQMHRLYVKYENDDRIKFLSHSIDYRRDSVPRLKEYATKLGVEAPKWNFVTGDKRAIYDIAYDYMTTALEDTTILGGFDHSGALTLIDNKRHIRSFCDGTDPKSVDKFMKDIDWLLENMPEDEK